MLGREGRAPPLRRGMEAFAPVHRKTRIDRASLATEPYIPIKVLLRPYSLFIGTCGRIVIRPYGGTWEPGFA